LITGRVLTLIEDNLTRRQRRHAGGSLYSPGRENLQQPRPLDARLLYAEG